MAKKEINIRSINVQIIVSVFLCIILLSGYFVISSYNNSIDEEEKNVLKRLRAITNTIALQIDGDAHQAVFERYTEMDGINAIDQDSNYYRIHQVLADAYAANELNSAIYTAVYDEAAGYFLFGVTSDNTTYFRHTYTTFPQVVLDSYQVGGVVPNYEDAHGSWLSAFTPIQNSQGEVVAIVQSDLTFDDFIMSARKKLLTNILISVAVILIIGAVLLVSLQSVLKKDKIAKKELVHSKLVIEEKQRELLESITYAKRIQEAILPPRRIVERFLPDSFTLYKPKDIVAGDFYWVEPSIDGKKVLFAAADCTGHGVPGALVSVVCHNALNRAAREFKETDPGKLLDKAREIVIDTFEKSDEQVKDGMDIALCSLEGNTLQYAGAHNPLWIIRKDSDSIEEIKACKQPIGDFHQLTPYQTHEVQLHSGDTLYIFSDGFVDQFGGLKGKKLKTANFKKFLLSIQQETMAAQRKTVNDFFENWRGDLEQLDDVCVLGVRV